MREVQPDPRRLDEALEPIEYAISQDAESSRLVLGTNSASRSPASFRASSRVEGLLHHRMELPGDQMIVTATCPCPA